jgi:DNA helicase-2/ATP-dependent DNA helicase PcrA
MARFKYMELDKKFQGHPILEHAKLNNDSVRYIQMFYRLVMGKPNTASPRALVEYIVKSEQYTYIADKLATKRGTRKDKSLDEKAKTEAKERIYSKTELIKQLAGHYQDTNRFINAMILGSGEMSEGEGVNLLSVHASKGLEFEEVYVIDLMDGRFPNHKLMNQGGSLDEERRLFYVAVTRAKTQLCLSYAKYNKARKTDYVPSPFLVEAGMVKKIEL